MDLYVVCERFGVTARYDGLKMKRISETEVGIDMDSVDTLLDVHSRKSHPSFAFSVLQRKGTACV